MFAMTVPTTCTAIRRARFGAPVRQNKRNSQNEPRMSFGINKPCRTRSGPDMVAGGFQRLIEGGFGVNSGTMKHREKVHGWKKRQPWLPTRSKRRQGGRLLPIPGGAYIAVFAMCAMTVPTTCTAIRRARFGAPVRQNNQNSQNEPGMSFGINQIVIAVRKKALVH